MMHTIDHAAALIRQIDAAGGPPPEDAARYHAIRGAVREALSSAETDLGFAPLLFLAWGGAAAALAFLGLVAYKTAGTAVTATRTIYWLGTAWVGYQLWKLR